MTQDSLWSSSAYHSSLASTLSDVKQYIYINALLLALMLLVQTLTAQSNDSVAHPPTSQPDSPSDIRTQQLYERQVKVDLFISSISSDQIFQQCSEQHIVQVCINTDGQIGEYKIVRHQSDTSRICELHYGTLDSLVNHYDQNLGVLTYPRTAREKPNRTWYTIPIPSQN